MKKLIIGCVGLFILSMPARAEEYELLTQWLTPLLRVSAEQALAEDEDHNPQYQACVTQMFSAHVLPKAMTKAIQNVNSNGDTQNLQALESFLSIEGEREEFAKNIDYFNLLMATRELNAAQNVWADYMDSTVKRMPENVQQDVNVLVNSIDLSEPMDQVDFSNKLLLEPLCSDYMKSLEN